MALISNSFSTVRGFVALRMLSLIIFNKYKAEAFDDQINKA
jgi:hypothetical protein